MRHTAHGYVRPVPLPKVKQRATDSLTLVDEMGDAILNVGVCPLHREDAAKMAADIATAINLHEALKLALLDVLNEASGNKKSCGHEFTCVCPMKNAREVLKLAGVEFK